MERIKRVLTAENGFLLNEVTALDGRRVAPAGWLVTSRHRPKLVRLETRAAAERYFCDEARRPRLTVKAQVANRRSGLKFIANCERKDESRRAAPTTRRNSGTRYQR